MLTGDSTDELRLAVREVICENKEERNLYEDALIAITVDESLKRYAFFSGKSSGRIIREDNRKKQN